MLLTRICSFIINRKLIKQINTKMIIKKINNKTKVILLIFGFICITAMVVWISTTLQEERTPLEKQQVRSKHGYTSIVKTHIPPKVKRSCLQLLLK